MIHHSRYNLPSTHLHPTSAHRSPLRPGNRKNEKQRNLRTMGCDSGSCSSGITEDDSFTLELGWRSSKGSFGPPVKKLLADEMSKETEMKKRSPSIIAKLMGLDGMPPTRCANNRQKCPSEGSSPRCISKEKVGRRGTYLDGQVTKRSSKDQQEFKDVFEVLETSKTGQSRNPDQGAGRFEVAESEMAFIRQKFLDAKRLSTDEKTQDSREFHDALDALESNRDLLLKFLHQPGSLFARHLHDLQDVGSCSVHGCLPAIESLDNRKCDYPGFRGNSGRGTPPKNSSKSNNNHSSYSDSSFSAHSSKSFQILESKDELDHLPTRIVVLKPNIGKVQNAERILGERNIIFQAHSFEECSDLGDLKTAERRNKDFRGKKDSLDKKVVSRHSCKESREIPNGKARQMRNEVSVSPLNSTCSNFQGYAGDESSCSLSGNESSEEPVMRNVNLKSSSNLNMGYRQSSSRHKESSISREAKKRLTARWRSSRISEDKGVVSRGSTLADMLAANAKEVTLADSYAQIAEEGFPGKFSNDVQPGKKVEPFGISSNDGWKDDRIKLTRSRSLPASSIGFGRPKTVHRSNKHLISKELKRENNKAVKINFDQRECLPWQKSTPSKITPSFKGNQISMNTYSLDHSSSKIASTEFEASCSSVNDRNPISQSVEDDGDGCTMTFHETPNDLELDSSEHISTVRNSCVDHQDNTMQEEEPSVASPVLLHKSVPALESPATSKEADQPSPVSVLEPAFGDDLSSCSECFESVSADLQGLRMQLQLLKFESEAFTEGPMVVSSDEDSTEVSSELPPDEKKGPWRTNDSWEFSYLLDILTNAGLNNNCNASAVLATLHSSDCPIDPKMFEQLEEKHSVAPSTTRSDRKLLFDQIYSGIMTISQQFMDPQPWAGRRGSKTQIARKWMMKNEELQNRICKFLHTQIVTNDIVEEESQWQDLGDEIDVIGREIERLMINEVLDEIVTM